MEPSKFLDSRRCGETRARRLACPELAPRQAPRMVPVYRRLTLRHSTHGVRSRVSKSLPLMLCLRSLLPLAKWFADTVQSIVDQATRGNRRVGVEPGGPDAPVGAVPARTLDLSALPPTCITIGALDLFLEETLEYTRRLNRAGVPTELHVIPGAWHGFPMAGTDAPQVQPWLRLRSNALARAFSGLLYM
jgi:acetyl esterase/lipase